MVVWYITFGGFVMVKYTASFEFVSVERLRESLETAQSSAKKRPNSGYRTLKCILLFDI